jgi:hypothetical protein
MKAGLLCMVALLLLPGCERKEAPPTEVDKPAPVAAPAVTPSASKPAEPVVDVDALPVEEEFESEAEKTITPANLNAQLDALEKEIDAGP